LVWFVYATKSQYCTVARCDIIARWRRATKKAQGVTSVWRRQYATCLSTRGRDGRLISGIDCCFVTHRPGDCDVVNGTERPIALGGDRSLSWPAAIRAFQFGQKKFLFDSILATESIFFSIRFGNLINLPLVDWYSNSKLGVVFIVRIV